MWDAKNIAAIVPVAMLVAARMATRNPKSEGRNAKPEMRKSAQY